ncbi:hypothetical protein [Lacrimispora sp. JR3]|uniref:hypothetical protein n=1 Tax=Lacrimispora sinapis TaxID=3111456 RepID=UPI0037493AC8
MLRFRNPGTQYSTQVQVIKQLYNSLGSQAYFTLEDMAIVIAQGKLLTAYGYAGDDALRLSNTDQESMNSALMNAKMYAEVFRMLGWVTPYGEKSYPLVFTYIGIHVALSKGDCSRLYEQCVLGINNPTELTDRMSYDEKVRFFKCALRSFIDLGGVMYKHELCLGPMSVNDENEIEYQAMIKKISELRGNYQNLKTAFSDLADSLGMKTTPVDNCTRLPIAFMKSCNFVESYTTRELYNKSLSCLKITQHGIDTYNAIREMKDLRLNEFKSYGKDIQMALIRLGIYSMLERSGYDMTEVETIIQADKEKCSTILEGKELLFSPYQTIKRDLIEEALGIEMGKGETSQNNITTFESTVNERESLSIAQTWTLNVSEEAAMELLTEAEDIEFINEVNRLKLAGNSSKEIVDMIFKNNATATQTTFYPLISTLFKIMGFNCSFSRPGDNGARWDAIIDDVSRSIPIEIKSPTEEQHISIKAIRQALENKIILLSRKTHITSPEVTTLAVGYYLPNDRAEVSRLISDFKETYGYKIGVIDLKSLLSIAVSILVDGKGFDKENLYVLEGLVNANI